MSDLFDRLEGQLREAARDQVARRRRPRQAPWVRRWLPMALTAGVAAAVAVVALVALSGPTPSTSPSGHPAHLITREDAGRAESFVFFHTTPVLDRPVCQTYAPPLRRAEPSDRLRSELAALRRPQVATDRTAGRIYGGRVYLRYVRLARVVEGVRYYLIPALVGGATGSSTPRCLAAQSAAVRRAAASLSPGYRIQVLAAERRKLRRARRQAARPPIEELCTGESSLLNGRHRVSGTECDTTSAASLHQAPQEATNGTRPFALAEVVPNDVTAVRFSIPGRHVSLTVHPRDNWVIAPFDRHPGLADFARYGLQTTWIGPNGHVISTAQQSNPPRGGGGGETVTASATAG